MTKEEIDLILNRKNDEVVEAHKEIIALQKGTGHIIYTGLSHLDFFLTGGLNNKMVFIGSRPSMGKTFHCETTINSLLDEKINPNPNISILRLNLEMQTRSLLLRDLKKSLGKKMIDIISTPYTEEEQVIVKQVVAKHRDKRIINFSRIVEGEDLKYLINSYRKNIDEQDAKLSVQQKLRRCMER
jgi:replicative DNA helicase